MNSNNIIILKECCNHSPTLRVREKRQNKKNLTYVQYECNTCGWLGGLAITEEEAAKLWNENF